MSDYDIADYDVYNSNLLSMWMHPVRIVLYARTELTYYMKNFFNSMFFKCLFILAITALLAMYLMVCTTDFLNNSLLFSIYRYISWSFYWIGMGMASSIGLGIGLHTFVLYLGPFIARVTMAAYECGSLNFPSPPYPYEIVCPKDKLPFDTVLFLDIFKKLRWEIFLWGFGTALGELPPFFMARASSSAYIDGFPLNGSSVVDEPKTLIARLKHAIEKLVERIGFFGILLCASFPNPLFDVAGLTCGHFGISFWTFFVATLIGKAFIKASLQSGIVMLSCSQHHIENMMALVKLTPMIGEYLEISLENWLRSQKNKFHRVHTSNENGSLLPRLYIFTVLCMLFLFFASLIHSLARNHVKRKILKTRHHKPD